jgi:glycosyltransferase involved in cell wall biosynthesis
MEKLYIIIPAYNEEKTIEEVVRRVKESSTPGFEKEIIVVNDGSTDNTLKILKEIQPHYLFNLINYSQNKGKGFAVKKALDEVSEGVVLIQDADFEYNPQNYPKLLKEYNSKKQPVVYGARKTNPENSGYFLYSLGNKLLNRFFNLLFRTSLTDIYTCYKVFRYDIIKKIEIKRNDFAFEGEMTANIIKSGYSIKETPIDYTPRSFKEGKKIRLKDGLIGAKVVFQNRLNNGSYTFLKYSLGGGLSYGIRIGVTALLTEIFGFYYLHSYITALAIAAVVGFYYSSYITFKKTDQKIKRGTKFALTWIGFHFFDAFLVWLSTNIIGLHYTFSITAVAILLFVLKFFWFKKLVFN